MTTSSTNAASAEVTVIDTHARGPLLVLLGTGIAWLLLSGVLALISAIQLHTPAFLSTCEWFSHGRVQAMQETAFVYGWAGNAGLAIGLWILGRLGGHPLRALNWVVVGSIFWSLAVLASLLGIASGDMTSFALLQLPRYVQPLLVVAYAAMAISGVLAWSGRKRDVMYASQWYAVAALFLFPWLLTASQTLLFWAPVRGIVQVIGAAWFGQGVLSLWLTPLALAAAYYLVPKLSGRALPSYEAAPLGFWTLIFLGTWTAGRQLIGGPVPAWIPTMAVVGASLLLFHYVVVVLNLRVVLYANGTAMKFISFGLVAYLLSGLLDTLTAFRGIAIHTQFTFVAAGFSQINLYGAITMLFFGAIYYLVPRLMGRPWASPALTAGHQVMVMLGVVGVVGSLIAAGATQGELLAKASTPFSQIFDQVRVALLLHSASQFLLLGANLLFFVNFARTACSCCEEAAPSSSSLFRQPSALEAPAS